MRFSPLQLFSIYSKKTSWGFMSQHSDLINSNTDFHLFKLISCQKLASNFLTGQRALSSASGVMSSSIKV